MNHKITIQIDDDKLEHYTDQYLSTLWHVAQANPQDGFKNREPGELAERIGREIIRRFLAQTPPPLWDHQASHFESAKVADDRIGDAKRIVACVKACEGISDEALDSWMNPPGGGLGHPHGPWPKHIISLQRAAGTFAQQRDEMVEAIQQTLNENRHLADGDVCTLKRLKDALSKVGAGEMSPAGDDR